VQLKASQSIREWRESTRERCDSDLVWASPGSCFHSISVSFSAFPRDKAVPAQQLCYFRCFLRATILALILSPSRFSSDGP
jgi:hypothetical protein